jgi:hypothetical protein
MASSNPIIIYRGEHVYIPFQMTPNTDITGWTLRMHVAKKYDAAVKLLSDLAPEITAPATGAFRFLLTAEQTDLKPGVYVYDVWRTDVDNERMVAIGVFTIKSVVRLPTA